MWEITNRLARFIKFETFFQTINILTNYTLNWFTNSFLKYLASGKGVYSEKEACHLTTLSLFTIEACTRHPDRMTPESLVSAMCKNIWDVLMHAWYQKCFQGSDGVGWGWLRAIILSGGGPMIILDLPFRSTIWYTCYYCVEMHCIV